MSNINNLALRFKYGEEVSIDKDFNVYCAEQDEKAFFEGDLALFFAENPQYKESHYPLLHYKERLEEMGAEVLEFHLYQTQN